VLKSARYMLFRTTATIFTHGAEKLLHFLSNHAIFEDFETSHQSLDILNNIELFIIEIYTSWILNSSAHLDCFICNVNSCSSNSDAT
jgi:hypothetical protein